MTSYEKCQIKQPRLSRRGFLKQTGLTVVGVAATQAPVGDSVKSLSFRKDTSSGSASKENRNKKK